MGQDHFLFQSEGRRRQDDDVRQHGGVSCDDGKKSAARRHRPAGQRDDRPRLFQELFEKVRLSGAHRGGGLQGEPAPHRASYAHHPAREHRPRGRGSGARRQEEPREDLKRRPRQGARGVRLYLHRLPALVGDCSRSTRSPRQTASSSPSRANITRWRG